MVKHKTNALAKLPKEQRSQFLIGPVSSWFMSNTTDIWTQSSGRSDLVNSDVSIDESMDCDQTNLNSGIETTSLSYFIYGSIGCFCYGQLHYHRDNRTDPSDRSQSETLAPLTMTISRLIDVKEDNSRVACVRFLKGYSQPLVMVLTESSSLLIHDCLSSENIIHFRRSELIDKYVEPYCKKEETNGNEHNAKRTKFNVTQQINSCLWPNACNAFLGVSLLKEKTNLLIWLKMKDLTLGSIPASINKSDLIESHQIVDLGLPNYANPICCMESAMIDSKVCLIAIAMDDGFICVVKLDLVTGQSKRTIQLARHNDQISSLSFYAGNSKKFPSGLLASVSRDGLTLVWDVENEFYFADYQALSAHKGSINWFTLCFVSHKNQVNLIVSNPESGLTVLEIPENTRSKTRLKDNRELNVKQKGRQVGGEQTLRHHALLFNVVYEPETQILVSTSLDGNHIIWSCNSVASPPGVKRDKKNTEIVQVRAEYMYPSMSNESRTHMLRFNPIKEDLLGVALGKGRVRFYKVSDGPRNYRFDMNPSCGLIARKINKASLTPTSIAWHPSHEYRIAIGTIEGKVFRADLTPHRAALVDSEFKPTASSSSVKTTASGTEEDIADDLFGVEYQPLKRTDNVRNSWDNNDTNLSSGPSNSQQKTDGVYSLCWGPNPTCPQDTSRLAIYAISSISKRLFIYYNRKDNNDKMMNYLDEFHDQSLPEAIGQSSEISWKSSMDLMALGTTSGKVIIAAYLEDSHASRINNLFRKLAVIEGPFGTAHIQCLAWHPTTDKLDARYYYLAVASTNEPSAFVFNIKEGLLIADIKSQLRLEGGNGASNRYEANVLTADSQHDSTDNGNIVSQYMHKLSGHKKPISDIVWSPHDPNQLASSSFDRSCIVWSVDRALETDFMEARILAKFFARDRLFTLEWSNVDSDLIFTSGHDSSIWAWRPSENPPRNSNENT